MRSLFKPVTLSVMLSVASVALAWTNPLVSRCIRPTNDTADPLKAYLACVLGHAARYGKPQVDFVYPTQTTGPGQVSFFKTFHAHGTGPVQTATMHIPCPFDFTLGPSPTAIVKGLDDIELYSACIDQQIAHSHETERAPVKWRVTVHQSAMPVNGGPRPTNFPLLHEVCRWRSDSDDSQSSTASGFLGKVLGGLADAADDVEDFMGSLSDWLDCLVDYNRVLSAKDPQPSTSGFQHPSKTANSMAPRATLDSEQPENDCEALDNLMWGFDFDDQEQVDQRAHDYSKCVEEFVSRHSELPSGYSKTLNRVLKGKKLFEEKYEKGSEAAGARVTSAADSNRVYNLLSNPSTLAKRRNDCASLVKEHTWPVQFTDLHAAVGFMQEYEKCSEDFMAGDTAKSMVGPNHEAQDKIEAIANSLLLNVVPFYDVARAISASSLQRQQCMSLFLDDQPKFPGFFSVQKWAGKLHECRQLWADDGNAAFGYHLPTAAYSTAENSIADAARSLAQSMRRLGGAGFKRNGPAPNTAALWTLSTMGSSKPIEHATITSSATFPSSTSRLPVSKLHDSCKNGTLKLEKSLGDNAVTQALIHGYHFHSDEITYSASLRSRLYNALESVRCDALYNQPKGYPEHLADGWGDEKDEEYFDNTNTARLHCERTICPKLMCTTTSRDDFENWMFPHWVTESDTASWFTNLPKTDQNFICSRQAVYDGVKSVVLGMKSKGGAIGPRITGGGFKKLVAVVAVVKVIVVVAL